MSTVLLFSSGDDHPHSACHCYCQFFFVCTVPSLPFAVVPAADAVVVAVVVVVVVVVVAVVVAVVADSSSCKLNSLSSGPWL